MDFLQTWGIAPNTIEDMAHLCEDALAKAGYTPTEIDEWYDNVRHNTIFDNEYITDSIIQGYFFEAAKMLREKGYKVDYYVDSFNYASSYFAINGVPFQRGSKLPNLEQLKAYEKYKDDWIKEHISDEVMKETIAIWKNDEDASDVFEEYIDEYGFANGEVYASYSEFLDNEYTAFRDDKTTHDKSTDIERD